ncbi:histidine-containing phosphotransfer protein 1 [Eucalyptus grandis]|uniref:histidine-containing phosphotransfer protein 1 n=1 Tax=Eucalyptus grandis TaxID=71139 RepID=UPI00192EEFAE|nr:histidine-containing phosphotransfer protein 1 [Eucalyptus grandis]
MSMNVGQMQLQKRLVDYKNSPITEGILDSQYLQLLGLQDESNPNLVVEVASLFFTDAEQLLNDLSRELTQQNVDFQQVDVHVDRLEGQSPSIGAPRLKNACIAFRHFRNTCQETNIPVYLRCLENMRQEFLLVKSKLETLFNLEQQIAAAGGTIPIGRPHL